MYLRVKFHLKSFIKPPRGIYKAKMSNKKQKSILGQIMFIIAILGLGFVIMGAWNRNVLMMIIGIILIVIRGFVVTNKNK